MDKYIGVKIISAEPVKADKDYGKHKAGEDGYKVVYEDGYTSWSPKDVFEKVYRKFGNAKNTVTQEDVDNFIAAVDSSKFGDKTIVVMATLANGFIITESSSCVDPANFDMAIGIEICLEKIKDKVWFLLGFLLQCGIGGLNR